VYPNPAKDVLYIRNGDKSTITVIDASGKTVLSQNITGNGSIDISRLPDGLYYVTDHTSGEVIKVMVKN